MPVRSLVRFALACALLLAACDKGERRPVILATTTSTYDTGLLDALLPEFERASGFSVKVIAVGTGEALRMGERGDADVLLVHAPEAEEEFMRRGFGSERKAVMHNDFVLLGPPADPAGVKGSDTAAALSRIAAARAQFVSRADASGTHKKELALWAGAGVKPGGSWYIEAGQGMGACLRIATEKQAYILADRGTWLALQGTLDLAVVVEGDPKLFNPYHVITVSQRAHPRVNADGARAFMDFITGAKARALIGEFGKAKYGQPLFVPDAPAP